MFYIRGWTEKICTRIGVWYDTELCTQSSFSPIDHNYFFRGGNFLLQIIPSNWENFSLTKSPKASHSNLDGCYEPCTYYQKPWCSCNKRNHNIDLKIKTFYLLEEARTHWALVHGRVPFLVVSGVFLRIFSIVNRAISTTQAKRSITIRNASTEVLQFFFRIRLPLEIIWTSALFTVLPSKCVSSCFVNRYRESVIVLSNCHCKVCYDTPSILEMYCLHAEAKRRLEVLRSV